MGALFQNVCYSTSADAADAFFLAKGVSYTAGATSYQSWFEKNTSGVWQIKRQSISSSGAITNLTTSNATVPTFPTCDPTETFFDGLSVGWGIALVMAIAWSWHQMKRQAR